MTRWRAAGLPGRLGGLAPVVLLGVLFVWPLAEVLHVSLRGVGPGDALELLATASVRQVLWFTVGQALLSTMATLLVGLPIAHALARYSFRGSAVARSVAVVPFVLPTLVVAAAFDALIGLAALDRGRWDLDNSLIAVLAAHVFFNVAIVVRVVGGYWSTLDGRMDDAARLLGAGPFHLWRTIVLPRLAPVIAGAASLVFLFSFTSFGIILVLGGPTRATVETEIYRYAIFRQEFDTAAVLALAQLVFVTMLAILSTRLQLRLGQVERRRGVTGTRPVATRRQRLHLVAVLALVGVVMGAPMLALVERSVRVGDGYGLDHFAALTGEVALLPVSPARALGTSLAFAVAAAAIAVAVGAAAAPSIVRGGWLGRLIDIVSFVPLGTSAVTLGLGYLLAFTMLDLRQSPWLVPLAHSVIGLPFVLGSLVPTLRSIDRRLREAAAVLGATPLQVRRSVEWPLTQRAVVTGAGFVVAVSLGEFGATSFLSRGADSFTAPLAIFRLLSQPGSGVRGQAMALSVVIGVLVAALAYVLERRRGTGATVL